MHVTPVSSATVVSWFGSPSHGTPNGVSQEAKNLSRELEEVDRHLDNVERTIAGLSVKIRGAVVAEIDRVVSECSDDGWNGEEECIAVEEASALLAKSFISMVDLTQTPMPDVVPEPDGDLALEWHRDYSRWLLISFNAEGRANYACRTGEGDRLTGTSRITQAFRRTMEQQLALVFAD